MSKEFKTHKPSRLRVDDAERRNLSAIVEHLIISGNYARHEEWKAQEWKRRRREIEEARPRKGLKRKVLVNAELPSLHPQSIRLYGHDGNEAEPWPKRRRFVGQEQDNLVNNEEIRLIDDEAWNSEVGDGIDPIFFNDYRLSMHSDCVDQESISDDYGKDTTAAHQRGDMPRRLPLTEAEATRLLLLRCWERAVHAASTTMHVDPYITRHSDVDSSSSALSENDDRDKPPLLSGAEPLNHQMAKRKCAKLGIGHIPPNNNNSEVTPVLPPFACPQCRLQLETEQELVRHFYGSTDNVVRGCCWGLVRKTQRSILRTVLQNEVKNQLSNVLHFVLVQCATHLKMQKVRLRSKTIKGQKGPVIFGWDEVLGCFEAQLAIATACDSNKETGKTNALQETLQTASDSSRTPLVLNPLILESVIHRLVGQYGKVPR